MFFLWQRSSNTTKKMWKQAFRRRSTHWQCVRLSIGRLCVRSATIEWLAVALLGQDCSPQPPRQEALFKLRPTAYCLTNLSHCMRSTTESGFFLAFEQSVWPSSGFISDLFGFLLKFSFGSPARGPRSFSCGPRELCLLQKMLQKPVL